MARRRARARTRYVVRRIGRRAKKTTIPLAVVAGFAPLAVDTINTVRDPNQGFGQIPHVLGWHLLGINTWDNNKFEFGRLVKGWSPIIAGIVAHKLAGKFGVNRMLASAGVPFLRV